MVWIFRLFLGLTIVAYAAWLVWPMVSALTVGASIAQLRSMVEGPGDLEASAAACAFLGMTALYAAAGGLTVAGQSWATGVYFLAIGAEILLRLEVVVRGGGAQTLDLAARTAAALQRLNPGLDVGPLSLGLLVVIGLLVLAQGVWRGHKGAALTQVWIRPPVYA